MPNFMKIRQVRAELFHTEGQVQTDRHDEAKSRYSNFFEHEYTSILTECPLFQCPRVRHLNRIKTSVRWDVLRHLCAQQDIRGYL
jgi:hypothetical protein